MAAVSPGQVQAPTTNVGTNILYILLILKLTAHTLRRMRFALVTLVATLCLLGVQQGAAFHALSHLAAEDSTKSQKQVPHTKTCDQCIAYAEVSGAGPTTVHATLRLPSQLAVLASAAWKVSPYLALQVYPARAPPIST